MRAILAAALATAILGSFACGKFYEQSQDSAGLTIFAETVQEAIQGALLYANRREEVNGAVTLVVGEAAVIVYGSNSMSIGHCAGFYGSGNRTLLLGDYTSAPSGKDGFVNIANKLCFWRDSGERVTCPPPEPECVK